MLGLIVFLSAFGVWAKQSCKCGCLIGLSSCFGILAMLLELTLAIVTLTAKDKAVQALCTKVLKGTWDASAKQCQETNDSLAAGVFDGSGSGGGDPGKPDAKKMTGDVIADYQKYAPIIAYVLFGLAFLQLCRFLMGRYVEPEMSDLDTPLNSSFKVSSRDNVEDIRARNRYVRSQEAAMKEGRPMAPGADPDEINIKEESSCVIS